MAFCEYCGRELSDQAVACPNCGHPRVPAVVVKTQQGVAYAEWWQRAVALIIDVVLIGVVASIIIRLSGVTVGSITSTDQFGNQTINGDVLRHLLAVFGVVAAIGIAYRTILEGSMRGQTVGKMAMKIAVKDAETGRPIGYGRAFTRWLIGYVLWFLFYIPGIIDLLFPLWDQRKQTLHDKVVKSVVLQVP